MACQVLFALLVIVIACYGSSFGSSIRKQRSVSGGDYEKDVRMPKITFDQDGVKMCTSEQMSNYAEYIVGIQPYSTMRDSCQMQLHFCQDIIADPGRAYECMSNNVCQEPSTAMFVWANDSPDLLIPEGVGFHMGKYSNNKFVTLQIYCRSKDDFQDGENDMHGIKLTITRNTPESLADVHVFTGHLSTIIPAYLKEYNIDFGYGFTGEDPIHIFAFRVNAREIGTLIRGYIVEDGKWKILAHADPNWPKAQVFYSTSRLIQVKQGDMLKGRCTYNSMEREKYTIIGSDDGDELCMLSLMYYYPANIDASSIRFRFKPCFKDCQQYPPYSPRA